MAIDERLAATKRTLPMQTSPTWSVPMIRSSRDSAADEPPLFRSQDHQPMLVSRALMLLAGEWTTSGAVRRLDPNQVLAEAWQPYRLARCRERLAAGEQAPAIAVVGFRLGRRQVLYGVSDGMHRTVAHREAGQRIKAEISGTYVVEPTRHVLWRDHLWRRDGEQLQMLGLEELPEELRLLLLALGVKAET